MKKRYFFMIITILTLALLYITDIIDIQIRLFHAWPLSIIVAGLAFIYSRKMFGIIALSSATILFFAMIINVAYVNSFTPFNATSNDYTSLTAHQQPVNAVHTLQFAGGKLFIRSNDESIFSIRGKSSDSAHPIVTVYEKEQILYTQTIRNRTLSFASEPTCHWDIGLSSRTSTIHHELKAKIAGSEAYMDFSKIALERAHISSSLSSISYSIASPTIIEHDTTLDNILLILEKDQATVLNIEGPGIIILPNTFVKKDGLYFSPSYDASKPSVQITMKTRLSVIRVELK